MFAAGLKNIIGIKKMERERKIKLFKYHYNIKLKLYYLLLIKMAPSKHLILNLIPK